VLGTRLDLLADDEAGLERQWGCSHERLLKGI